MTLISNWKPANQFTPTAVTLGGGSWGECLPHGFDHQTHACLGIDEKHSDVDHIFKRASSRFEHPLQVVEGELNLSAEIGLGRAVFAGANHAGDKQEVAGQNGGRVAVLFVESVWVFGKYGFSGVHGRCHCSGCCGCIRFAEQLIEPICSSPGFCVVSERIRGS